MMKFIILFVCCLAITLAEESNVDEMDQFFHECAKELNISLDNLEDLRDSREEACLVECVIKKIGYMRADGTIDIEAIMRVEFRNRKDNVNFRIYLEQSIEKCTRIAKGDTCIFAKCLMDP